MEATLISAVIDDRRTVTVAAPAETPGGGTVSWPAVIAGALVIAALSVTLLALGAGFGFSAISPWSGVGASAPELGVAAIGWLIFMQVVASIFGGYLAGRLRTTWARIHSDEVYFRDTAHGFLAWSLAVILTGAFLASAATSMAGHSTETPSPAGASTPSAVVAGYYTDLLFRTSHPGVGTVDATTRAEAGRVLARITAGRAAGDADDQSYLSTLVAGATGLSRSDADQRVANVVTRIRQTEDTVRRDVARVLLWSFIALLTGAFCASVAATIGGRQRDHVVVV